MLKIAITTTSFGEYDSSPLDLCKAKGFEVILNPYKRQIQTDELIELCRDAIGLIAGTELISEEILLKLKSVKVISRCGAGLDNVDLAAAQRLGVKVFNTPNAPTLAVAELTVGLILNLLRKINRMDNLLRAGNWEKIMGSLLYQKNVGIIGFGRIGRKVAELLKPFDCQIAYADPFVKDGLLGLRQLPLADLLKWADIVSLHVSTKNKLLGEEEIRLMKETAWLVNVSRGGVVDEGALLLHLKEKKIAGAAIDVFENEPYEGALKELDNVVLTPHVGSYAKEARSRMEMEAVENMLEGLGKIHQKDK